MSNNYVIEIRPEPVGRTLQAELVVRDGSGFRFFAATQAFNSLESQIFKKSTGRGGCRASPRRRPTREGCPIFRHRRARTKRDRDIAVTALEVETEQPPGRVQTPDEAGHNRKGNDDKS